MESYDPLKLKSMNNIRRMTGQITLRDIKHNDFNSHQSKIAGICFIFETPAREGWDEEDQGYTYQPDLEPLRGTLGVYSADYKHHVFPRSPYPSS